MSMVSSSSSGMYFYHPKAMASAQNELFGDDNVEGFKEKYGIFCNCIIFSFVGERTEDGVTWTYGPGDGYYTMAGAVIVMMLCQVCCSDVRISC